MNNSLKVYIKSKGLIKPHFFLTGATGSGKTYSIKAYCAQYKLPVVPINCAQLTTEGMSGNSISRAFRPLTNYINKPCVIFLDEFDKLLVGEGNKSKEEFKAGVQDELLKVIEEGIVHILMDYGKYITLDISKCLFVLAGAFNGAKITNTEDLLQLGVISQLIGRVPLHYHMKSYSFKELRKMLHNSKLLDNYLRVFEKDKDAVIKDLEKSLKYGNQNCKIGARIINNVIHKYFVENTVYEEELTEQFVV